MDNQVCRIEEINRIGAHHTKFVFSDKPDYPAIIDLYKLNWMINSEKSFYYEILNYKDCLLYIPYWHLSVPVRFPRKYLPILRKFISSFSTLHKIGSTKNRVTTVGELLADIGGPLISIQMGSSRTLLNAYTRPAIAYAHSFTGSILFFKKKGGYLCYWLSKAKDRDGIYATEIHNLLYGAKLIKSIKKRKLASVIKLTKRFENTLFDEVLMKSI